MKFFKFQTKFNPKKDRANERGSTRVLLASNSPSLPERALVWSLESAIKDMGKDSAPENSSLGMQKLFRSPADETIQSQSSGRSTERS